MNDTPSATEQLGAAAARDKVLITDDRGRIIAVHRLNLLAWFDLAKVMGESAANPALMDVATTCASVRRIDTVDFAMPSTEADLRFLMQQLDFDGLKAASEGLRQLNAKADDGTKAAKN
ncbi:hypothetical protein SAMN05443247_00027 [Bradyrhizobium erythrophlei]|nr:hypothetical protein SAMN05443247_00027 [Bradyrhizobium erythrophlei]